MCTYHLQIILIKVFGNLEIRGTPQRVPALKEHKPSHQELATIAFMVRKENKEMIKTHRFNMDWNFIFKTEPEITSSVAALFLQVSNPILPLIKSSSP